MRDLINIVEAATIKSVSTGPGGNVDRNKADRVEDPQGFFKKAKSAHHNLSEEELDERDPGKRTIEIDWVVESYDKASNTVLSSKEFGNVEEAWELAKQFKRGATPNVGVRMVEVTKTSIVTRKVRNL